jgi:Chlorophyll A-B binding protein
MVKTLILACLLASATAFAPAQQYGRCSAAMFILASSHAKGSFELMKMSHLRLFFCFVFRQRMKRNICTYATIAILLDMNVCACHFASMLVENSSVGRVATKLFEDAAVAEPAAEAEAPAAPAAPAKKAYVASQSLPFLEQPPNLVGYVGDVGFDPFRFSDFIPVDFLREAELKHGRIAMMAVVGFAAVDLGMRVYPIPPGYEGLTALTAHDALITQGAMIQLNIWFSVCEIVGAVAVYQMLNGSGREPGDFGLDPPQMLKGRSVEYVNNMKLKELTNGRLAMLAFSGMVTQATLYDSHFPFISS